MSVTVSVTRPMDRHEDLITAGLATWLVLGLFLDGWAHNTRPGLETFFTPWHAVFYSGFASTCLWVAWSIRNRRFGGGAWWDAVPVGYGPAVAGLAVFAASGLFDMCWHVVFGIERNEAALLSPTHLGLYTGAFLVVSAPFRSRWSDPSLARRPSWRQLAPAMVSVALASDLTAFILQNFSPIRENPISKAAGQILNLYQAQFVTDRAIEHVVASFMLATVFMFGPVLYLLRRWDLPVGAVAVLVGSQVVLMQSLRGFEDPGLMVLGLIGAGAAEYLAYRLRPDPERLGRLRMFAGLAPAAFWGCYLAGVALHDNGLGFKAEIWGGTLVWTSLVTIGMTLLIYPPRTPPPTAEFAPPDSSTPRGRCRGMGSRRVHRIDR